MLGLSSRLPVTARSGGTGACRVDGASINCYKGHPLARVLVRIIMQETVCQKHSLGRAVRAGVYPFAGRECARALALISTEVSDCNGKVDDLGYVEQVGMHDEWVGMGTELADACIMTQRRTACEAQREGLMASDGEAAVSDARQAGWAWLHTSAGMLREHRRGRMTCALTAMSLLQPHLQENLRDWTAKFRFKYPIVGKIVKEGAGGKQ